MPRVKRIEVKPVGKPPHVPTDQSRKQVMAFCGFGLTHDQIAEMLDISDETLRKYYRRELDIGLMSMNAAVANNLYTIATSKESYAVGAAIFWLKSRGQWKDKQPEELNVTMKQAPLDLSALPYEQRQALKAVLVNQMKTIEHSPRAEDEE